MKIDFTPTALAELDNIREHLQDVSPSGLRNVLTAIQSTIRDIPDSIARGRSTPHEEVWEKVIPKYGYIIPYLVFDDTVVILRVFNSRRQGLDYEQLAQDIERIKNEPSE